jgi:hypothetical protein
MAQSSQKTRSHVPYLDKIDDSSEDEDKDGSIDTKKRTHKGA